MANPCLSGSVSGGFDAPKLNAQNCKLSLTLPSISLSLLLNIPFPPDFIPHFNFDLKISCDLSNPIDLSGGLKFGGGRPVCADPDPDDDWES